MTIDSPQRPDAHEVAARERMKSAVLIAIKGDTASGPYRTINTLVNWGISVMLHGRSQRAAAAAGTKRWVVEMELYPICIVHECDGDELSALKETFLNFVKELNRHPEIQVSK